MAKVTIEYEQPEGFILCRVREDGTWDADCQDDTILVQDCASLIGVARDFGFAVPEDLEPWEIHEEAFDFLLDAAGTGKTIEDPGYFQGA